QPPLTILLQNGMYRCSSCKPPVQAKADGQEHKVTGQPDFDTLTVREIDQHTVEFARKKDGRPTAKRKYMVSDDGNTLHVEFTDHPAASDAPLLASGPRREWGKDQLVHTPSRAPGGKRGSKMYPNTRWSSLLRARVMGWRCRPLQGKRSPPSSTARTTP